MPLSQDENGAVRALVTQDVEIVDGQVKTIEGSEKELPCDLVILSMGFLNPEQKIIEALSLDIDQRNNIHAEYGDYRTSMEGVFSAGDCRRGQSLVVWAINEGRGVAESVDLYLSNKDYNTDELLESY